MPLTGRRMTRIDSRSTEKGGDDMSLGLLLPSLYLHLVQKALRCNVLRIPKGSERKPVGSVMVVCTARASNLWA